MNTAKQRALPKSFTPPHVLSGKTETSPILVAFSGGADSSALLVMLSEYGKITGAKIYAAHVNHKIRGEEADRDEEFCRKAAKNLDIEIFVLRCDVPAFAKKSGQSVEAAARQVRYEFFDSIMKEHSIPLLATAHNANDNLETMIFNMVRGSGLDGICGIPQTRSCTHGTVIRPILSMSRNKILAFCKENRINYVIDSTNTDTDYTRNKIRHEIIPMLKEINSGAIENAARLAASLRDDRLCLESMTDWFLQELGEDLSVETKKIIGSPPAIANRAIMALYSHASGGGTIEKTHVEAIRQLCMKAVPHSATRLPHGISAVIENDRLLFKKNCELPTSPDSFLTELSEGECFISQINAKIIIENSQINKNIYKNSILLYFDSDKIFGKLTARNRLAGDKILINGMHKSVKKLLCDKKIPLDVRYRLPILCDENGVLAVPFVAVRDDVQSKDFKSSLCVQIVLL